MTMVEVGRRIRFRNPVWWVLGLLLLLVSSSLHADSGFTAENRLGVVEDSGGVWDIDFVRQPANDRLFKPLPEPRFNRGYNASTFWFRFFPTARQRHLLELDGPLLDHVTLYRPLDSGRYQALTVGDMHPFADREVDFRNPVFHIDMTGQAAPALPYYLRVQSAASMNFSLRLHSSEGFAGYVGGSLLLFGLYYGTLLVMGLYNLLLFAFLRERVHLAYVAYIASTLLFILSMNGFGPQYLWPESAWLSSHATGLFLGVGIFFALVFVREFLDTGLSMPRVDRWIAAFMGLCALQVAMVVWGDYTWASMFGNLLGVILPLSLLGIGLYGWYLGQKHARFMVLAWLIFKIGIFMAGLMFMGILPRTFITEFGIQIGSVLEVILLSYALADKMAMLKRDKLAAEHRAAHHLRALNEELEQRVALRTGELRAANDEVEARNQALRAANVRLEELASHDSLTGLWNHRNFIERLHERVNSAQRYAYPLTVVMLDLDHFKQVNDRHGHPVGDQVLFRVARVLNRGIRESDVAARYGGEEFALILSHSSLEEALTKAEFMRKRIRDLRFPEFPELLVTASMGLASLEAGSGTLLAEDLLKQADEALYAAKREGRDRVVGVCAAQTL